MQETRRYASVEPFSNATSSNAVSAFDYTGQPEGSHSDAGIVQVSPKTVVVKRYVVMDTSQRDWVKQPNPFSNLVFTFGKQNASTSNPPVYYNNPFVPTFLNAVVSLL